MAVPPPPGLFTSAGTTRLISFRRSPQPLESLEGPRHLRLRIKRLLAFAGTLLEVRKCQGRGSPDYKPYNRMKLEM